MQPKRTTPSFPSTECGQHSNKSHSGQRTTAMESDQARTPAEFPESRTTGVPSTLRSLGTTDNAPSINTSPNQQSTEDHSLYRSGLEANNTIQAPDRDGVLAGSAGSRAHRSSAKDFSDSDDDDSGNDATKHTKRSLQASPSCDNQVTTPRKRQKAPATTTPRKRQKVLQEEVDEHDNEGDGDTPIDELIPYRSIKTIAVPERSNPESEPVEGDPKTYYGDMNYVDSMMTYWLDEVGYGYQKTAELCTEKIKRYTYEGVRKRHIATLQVHLRKYGRKDSADTPPPINEKVKNRGKPRALKKTTTKSAVDNRVDTGTGRTQTIGNADTQWTSGSTSADTNLPIYIREAPFRQIEATAIVVCKDLFGMEFSQIRDLMEKAYQFPKNENIENYYHAARPSAWGSKYHDYTNIEDNLDEHALSEKKNSEAAIKASMALSQDEAGDSHQTSSQRRPPVKISLVQKSDDVQLLVAPAPSKEGQDGDGSEFEV